MGKTKKSSMQEKKTPCKPGEKSERQEIKELVMPSGPFVEKGFLQGT